MTFTFTANDSPDAVVQPAPVDVPRRDAVRALLDAGTPPRPELAAAAAVLRAQRVRGFRPEDLAGLIDSLAGLDLTEVAAVRDHAWAIGKPAAPEGDPERGLEHLVGRGGPEIDLDDLFAGSPLAARMCRSAASVSLCSTDLTAMVLLAVASAAVAHKAVGRCENAVGGSYWVGPPALYLAAEVASGECKSLVRSQLAAGLERRCAAVTAWHEELATYEAGKRKLASVRKAIADGQVTRSEKAGDKEASAAAAQVAAAHEKELAKPATKSPSWLQWGAVTPERFGQQGVLGGFVACFPDEGKDLLSKFLGEGGGREYVGPLLTAFSGEWYSHETISGEVRGDRAKYNKFRAAIFLPIQPGVLSPATQQDGALLARMSQRGLLARLLIGRPRRPTAAERPALRRKARAEQADTSAVKALRAEFDDLMSGLVDADGQRHGAIGEGGDPLRIAEEEAVGRPHPLTPARPWAFTFDEDARRELIAYQDRTTDAAAPGGQWEQAGIAELHRRLADHAHRLATLLAILEAGGIDGGGEVRGVHVERAVRLLDGYFLPQALGVHKRAIFDPIGDDAEVVLDKLKTRGECTMRALRCSLPAGGRGWGKGKGSDKQTRLEIAVDSLRSHGRIAVEQVGRGSQVIRLVGD